MARIESETARLAARDGSQDMDDATSHLIREQVRAVMREELRAMSNATAAAAPLNDPGHESNPPPAYDSAGADTSPNRAPGDLHSEAARLLGEHQPPADVEQSTHQSRKPTRIARCFRALPGPVRFIIIMTPLVSVVLLMPILCARGDVLKVSVVAFGLLIANMFAFAIGLVSPVSRAPSSTTQQLMFRLPRPPPPSSRALTMPSRANR